MSVIDKPLGHLRASWQRALARRPLLVSVLVLAIVVLILLPSIWAAWLLIGALTAVVFAIPLAGLYLLPLAVAFGSLASIDVGRLTIGPTDVLVAVLVLAVLLRQLPRRWQRDLLPRRPLALARTQLVLRWRRERLQCLVFGAVIAYLAVIVVSAVGASDRTAAFKEIVKWSEVLAVLAATYWLARSPARVHWLAWTLVVAGVAEALLGDVQWVLASGDLGPGGASVRVFGTFAQPNPYAGYLNFALPLALALTVFSHERREQWVAGAAACVLLAAQVFADSRGALLGLAVAVFVLGAVGWRREREALLVGCGIIALVVVTWVAHKLPAQLQVLPQTLAHVAGGTLPGQVTSQNFSTMERLAHWIAGIRMFEAYPLLGVGAGNYSAAYPRYALPDWPEPLGHAHNYYINAAAETGFLGLCAFLFLVGAMLFAGWRITRTRVPMSSTRDVPVHALTMGFLAVLVALCVHNLTDDLFVHAMELQLALCLGCLLSLQAHTEGAP